MSKTVPFGDRRKTRNVPRCYNCGEKGHYSNKCPKPKKDKVKGEEATADMAMFVGVARFVTEIGDDNGGQEARNGDRTNDWDDSEFFYFGEICGVIEVRSDGTIPHFEIPTIVAEDSGTKFVEATTITVINHPIDHYAGYSVTRDFVGTADASCANGIEEWLLDSGATSGVTYDNSHMTDMRPSNRKIEIGNGDMIETFGQGTVTLLDSNGKLVYFTDVYYAPEFTKHIISFRQLIEKNWSLTSVSSDEFVWDAPMSTEPVRFKMNASDKL